MTRTHSTTAVLVLLSVFFTGQMTADNSSDTRMREILRNTMLQFRTAETDRANLQAAQAQLEQEKKALTDKVDALLKQGKADGETISGLKSKVADYEKETSH